jgi:hypothetical protein
VRALRISVAVAGLLVGCSSLPTTGDGIVAIEVRTPPSLTLRLGDSLTLHARALNQQGDSVAGVIRWFTVDTAAVTVDSIHGVVRARQATGTARIQASVGTLHSDPLTLLLAPALTTLVLPKKP